MPALAILLAAFAQDAPAPVPETLFACTTGRKRVEVLQRDGRLTYRFGPPGEPELTIEGGAGAVRHYYKLYPRGEDRHLRFASGGHSYIVYTIFNAPNHDGEGARDESGVLVVRGTRVIARLVCPDGGSFAAGYAYDGLPRDDDTYDPAKWDRK